MAERNARTDTAVGAVRTSPDRRERSSLSATLRASSAAVTASSPSSPARPKLPLIAPAGHPRSAGRQGGTSARFLGLGPGNLHRAQRDQGGEEKRGSGGPQEQAPGRKNTRKNGERPAADPHRQPRLDGRHWRPARKHPSRAAYRLRDGEENRHWPGARGPRPQPGTPGFARRSASPAFAALCYGYME